MRQDIARVSSDTTGLMLTGIKACLNVYYNLGMSYFNVVALKNHIRRPLSNAARPFDFCAENNTTKLREYTEMTVKKDQ